VLLVVNKIDEPRDGAAMLAEFHRLGLGAPIGVSAEHAHGLHDLDDAVLAALPAVELPVETCAMQTHQPARVA